MKRIAKTLAVAITSLAVFFSGCSNNVDGTVGNALLMTYMLGGSSTSSSAAGVTKELTVVATSNDKIINFSDSRTITPDAYTYNDLNFYLYGTDMISSTKLWSGNAKQVTFTKGADDFTGTVPVDLSVSNYKLTLVAVPKLDVGGNGITVTAGSEPGTFSASDALSKASLLAVSNADLRYNQTVMFYLSPDNLSGASGQIKLTVHSLDYDEAGNADKPWHDYHYYGLMRLENFSTGAVLASVPVVSNYANSNRAVDVIATGCPDEYKNMVYIAHDNPTWTSSSFTPPASIDGWGNFETAGGVTLTYTGVPSGVYNFVVEFANGDRSNPKTKRFYYSEKIIVLANQNIIADIKVPNVIENAPAPVSGFQVGYNDPDEIPGIETVDSGYYLATFQWDDNSVNEEYFVLQLMDVSKDVQTGGSFDQKGIQTNLSDTAAACLSAVALAPDTFQTAAGDPLTKQEAAKTAWNAETVIPTVQNFSYDKTVFQNTDSRYAAGSLDKNSTSVSLWLPLGSVYVARICAFNSACTALDAGPAPNVMTSDQQWVYSNTTALTSAAPAQVDKLMTVYTTTSTGNAIAGGATPHKWPAVDPGVALGAVAAKETNVAPLAINRYRVTYNFNGGRYWDVNPVGKLLNVYEKENNGNPATPFAAGDVDVTNKIKGVDSLNNSVTEYHTMTAAGTELMNPIIYAFNSNDLIPVPHTATLFNSGKPWTSWKRNSIDGDVISGDSKIYREVRWSQVKETGGDALTSDTENIYEIANTTFDAKYVDGTAAAPDTGKTYYVKSDYGYVKTTGYTSGTPQIANPGAYTLDDVKKVSKNTNVWIRNDFAKYYTFSDLNLFANYNEITGQVNTYSPDLYDLSSANIRITKEHGTGGVEVVGTHVLPAVLAPGYSPSTWTDQEVEGNAFMVSTYYNTLHFKLVEKANVHYTRAELLINTTGGKTVAKIEKNAVSGTKFAVAANSKGSGNGTNDAGAEGSDPLGPAAGDFDQYVFDVDTSSLMSGKYQVTFRAYTDVNEKNPFTYVVDFEYTDPVVTEFEAIDGATLGTVTTYDGKIYQSYSAAPADMNDASDFYKSDYLLWSEAKAASDAAVAGGGAAIKFYTIKTVAY
ncbi:MAG: hypothetical protein IIW71_02070 [Treponema sp.]|nr:hypothetical protein [Treponema sp.]